mmetsp:Transcript_119317/g.385244  ORF Transcript_119317/g.385244 Transcript_119317/m.385244 type:complete len:494 (+) Transcript_119317:93-1574(+)
MTLAILLGLASVSSSLVLQAPDHRGSIVSPDARGPGRRPQHVPQGAHRPRRRLQQDSELRKHLHRKATHTRHEPVDRALQNVRRLTDSQKGGRSLQNVNRLNDSQLEGCAFKNCTHWPSNVSEPENEWLARGHDIKVYIYKLPAHLNLHLERISEEIASTRGTHNFLFDTALTRLLKQSTVHRTLDPESADFFFVPLELAEMQNALTFAGIARDVLKFIDNETANALREIGPYWDTKPDRHILPSRTCPTGSRNMDWNGFPQLMSHRQTLLLCLEASRHCDRKRSLHVGYYVPSFEFPERLPERPTDRMLLATYMGAPINHYRKEVHSWMQNCSDCAAFNLARHGQVTSSAVADYHATLRRSRFGIEPPGDTLERMSRDVNVLLGAIPVIFEPSVPQQYLPWEPVLNWSTFSVTLQLQHVEEQRAQSFAPRLEKLLRGLVASGEADRLYAGVLQARHHLRWSEEGVLSTLMGMLAWHKAGCPGLATRHRGRRG